MEIEVSKTSFHQSLKGCRGTGESEGHPFTLIEAQWLHCECSQWFAFLIHLDLLVS